MGESRVVWTKDYHGFESMSDLDCDVYEALDERFNPKAKDIPGEFQGTIKVTMEYIPAEEEL